MASKKLIYADDARRAILQEDPKLAYCIERIKGVDAVEVVHGLWLMPKDSYDIVCSVCGGSCWYYDYDQTIGESNFCPNCGAKMDG